MAAKNGKGQDPGPKRKRTPPPSLLGEKLALALDQSGISQVAFSRAAKLSETQVSHIKTGVRGVPLREALRIATALGVDMAWLADDSRPATVDAYEAARMKGSGGPDELRLDPVESLFMIWVRDRGGPENWLRHITKDPDASLIKLIQTDYHPRAK